MLSGLQKRERRMRTIVRYLVAASLAFGFSQAPKAAEPPSDWNGFYVGGQIGPGWGKEEWTDPLGPPFDFGSHHADGWLGGIHLGANRQFGAWVAGVEGQYSRSSLKGSHINPADLADTLETKTKWL